MAQRQPSGIPGGVYYVVLRGRGGRPLFVEDHDPHAFGGLVARIALRCGARIHAYCWRWCTLRLVIQVHDITLPGVIQRIASQHARVINRKLHRKGYLFQHPHRSMPLVDPTSVLGAVRHIHLSSVEDNPDGDLLAYPWTSHRSYLGLDNTPWLTRQMVLELLGETRDAQPDPYRAFMSAPEEWRRCHPTVAPSHWLAPRLVDDVFFAWLKARADEQGKPASLEQLIEAVARQLQIAPATIASRSRGAALSLARAVIAWYAVQHRIASLAEVARRLGRGRSSLHETREKYRVLVPEAFNKSLREVLTCLATSVSSDFPVESPAYRGSTQEPPYQ
jgi:putative transposase